MPTFRLLIAYDGTDFRGWAKQRDPAVRTIAGVLEAELGEFLQEKPKLSVAGRTDAGVHARGQVVSFVSGSSVGPERLQRALNSRLAPEIVVREAGVAPDGFDARFSATAREYRYVIDAAEVPDPFTARFVWHRPSELSLVRMRAAAQALIGVHDFASFCRHPGEGRSTVRDLQRLTISRSGQHFVYGLRANAFLHQMVRSIVGTLVDVGGGGITPESVRAILAAKNRAAAGSLAPARGLTLERVICGRRKPLPTAAAS